MNDNQKIHQWAFPDECWHEGVTENWIDEVQSYVKQCPKCGNAVDTLYDQFGDAVGHNPDYHTDPSAMLKLIEAVREKGYETFTMGLEDDGKYYVNICFDESNTEHHWYIFVADTLPEAVAKAVLKLIEETK